MKVVRLHAVGDLRVHDEPEPTPEHGEELVRVTAVGLCGSDRHWFTDGGIGDAAISRPIVLGHEVAGVIEGGKRDGVRVALDPAVPCRRCDVCATNREHLCSKLRFAGHGDTDGGLREVMAWPSRLLHSVPDAIGDPESALLEPLGVALHALDLGQVRAAMGAGVYGCGPIGLMLVQLLCMMGCAPIVATDRLAHRVDAALGLGATDGHVVQAGSETAARALPAVDVAFEAAGDDAALATAVWRTRPGGRVVLVGIPSGDRTEFRASLVRRKELSLLLCRRMTSADLPRAISLASSGRVDLREVVSENFPIERVDDAFDRLVQFRGLKIVVTPSSPDWPLRP